MAQRKILRESVLEALGRTYTLRQEDLGVDARLSGKGMTFETESWSIEGVGHLCVMKMKAFLGMMQMETAVIAPTCVDKPLFNLDWVKAFGNETQMAELYDTQLVPWPDECQAEFDCIRTRYYDLPDTPDSGARWYDEILYPCSAHKKGKGVSERISQMAQDYLEAYVGQLANASVCNEAEKEAKVRAFAQKLFAEGGPAVDQVTKLFGEETAKRLIVQHMYGVK